MTTPALKEHGIQPHIHLREPSIGEGLLLAIVFGVAYIASFYLNAYVVKAQSVFTGVALFYLPAGVKLLAIMVARYWGALGLWVANFLHTTTGWDNLALSQVFVMSILWVGTTLLVVLTWASFTGLRTDLRNLTFRGFVWLNLLAAVIHGLVFNGYMVIVAERGFEEWLSSAKAMALGDFLGSGALMLSILLVYKAMKWLRR
jgi:hypothetical protein